MNLKINYQDIADQIAEAVKCEFKVLPGSRERLPAKWQADVEDVLFLDLQNYSAISEYSPQDQVITLGCGIQLSQLSELLREKSQWFPVSYGRRSTTLLDAIIYGECGFLEHLYGGPRRLVLGMTVALANGDLIRIGGKVVKNVSGYDLTRLIVGSLGVFGVPVSASLRLFACPEVSTTIALFHEKSIVLLEAAREIMKRGLPVSCLTVADLKLLENPEASPVDFFPVEHTERFALFVRFDQSSQVIEEVKSDLLSWASALPGIKPAVLQNRDFQIWPALYDLKNESSRPTIQIDVSHTVLYSWWQNEHFDSVPFIYSPGVGKLTFFPADVVNQSQLIKQLRDRAQTEGQSIRVTFLDEDCIRKTIHFAQDALVQKTLFQSLKERFDPRGCLNPIVDIY